MCDLFPPLIPVIIALARISALSAIQSAEIAAGLSVRVVRGPLHPLSNIPVAPVPIFGMGTPSSCSLLVV